jgi:hypothetical protein
LPKLSERSFQDNIKCSAVAEVSNEFVHGKGACSSLRKLVGENASGCDEGKRNNSSVSGETRSKKKNHSTNVAWIKKKCRPVVLLAQSFHLPAPGVYLKKPTLEIVSLYWIINCVQWVDVPLGGQELQMEIITIVGNLWYAHIC